MYQLLVVPSVLTTNGSRATGTGELRREVDGPGRARCIQSVYQLCNTSSGIKKVGKNPMPSMQSRESGVQPRETGQKLSLELIERQLRRKSFFAHICASEPNTTETSFDAKSANKINKLKFNSKNGEKQGCSIDPFAHETELDVEKNRSSLRTADELGRPSREPRVAEGRRSQGDRFALNIKKTRLVGPKTGKPEVSPLAISKDTKHAPCTDQADVNHSSARRDNAGTLFGTMEQINGYKPSPNQSIYM